MNKLTKLARRTCRSFPCRSMPIWKLLFYVVCWPWSKKKKKRDGIYIAAVFPSLLSALELNMGSCSLSVLTCCHPYAAKYIFMPMYHFVLNSVTECSLLWCVPYCRRIYLVVSLRNIVFMHSLQ